MSLLSNQELEERLTTAGNSLRQPPTSLDELLALLDGIEELLSKVVQSPPTSLQNVLSPLTKALVSEELMKHTDADVQVGVAACISEITRITAPDAPYNDDQMKDVFQLIVSSFDNLSDTSSRSYQKRATILETVAKVRSCVIMLDLEMDKMIIEMFQHFLKSIRVYHAELIFTSMETIMTLVLEESEYISADLLIPILDTLKKNNEEVLPVAKKLAENVIQNAADKLGACLAKALNTLNASLDDYSEVVASVCRKNSNSFGHSDENILNDQPATKDVKEEKPRDRDPSEDVKEEIKPQEKDPSLNGSPKSIACNSKNETGDEETVTDENFLNKEISKQQSDAKSTSETGSDDMGSEKPAQLEDKVEHVANGESRPFNSRNNSAESSDVMDDKKQVEQAPSRQEIPSEVIHTSPDESPPVEADKPSNTVKDITVQKEAGVEAVKVAPPIERGKLPDENQPKGSGRTKRKENMAKEDTASKKASEGARIAEVNKKQRTMKKQHGATIKTVKASNEGVPKNDAGAMSDSKARKIGSEKLGDVSNKKDEGSSRKEDGRKGGREKPKTDKDTAKNSVTEDNEKDISLLSMEKSAENEVSQEETPRTGTKRKRASSTDNKPQTYGKNLVGSKVKVLWPDDDTFYEGVIASYNPVNRKHKVVYDDGDTEILYLRNEQWDFVGDDSVLDGGQSAEQPGQDAPSNKKKKKGPAKSETSNKRGKDDPPKRKPKGSATKSASKSKDDGKAEPESTENSEDEADKSDGHYEEHEDESPDRSTKASGKYREVGVAKTSNKKKQDTQRSTNSKGKTPQSKGKIPLTGKTISPPLSKGTKKSSSSKAKTTEFEKSLDTIKGGGKSEGSGNKNGKKRRK